MANKPPIDTEKIIFGTMRLLEAGRTVKQSVEYFAALHELGIRALHCSQEYDSFPLLTEILRLLVRPKPDCTFRHVVKLAEPSFNDDDHFSADRLSRRIDEYRRLLRVDTIDDVQWMWRRKLDDDGGRISDFLEYARFVGEAVEAEKARGSISRVLCFPYSAAFAFTALDLKWVDGLAVYRNAAEHEYDSALEKAAALAKTAIVIRPFCGGKLVKMADPVELLTAALDGPAIEAAVLSTNSITHMRALLS